MNIKIEIKIIKKRRKIKLIINRILFILMIKKNKINKINKSKLIMI